LHIAVQRLELGGDPITLALDAGELGGEARRVGGWDARGSAVAVPPLAPGPIRGTDAGVADLASRPRARWRMVSIKRPTSCTGASTPWSSRSPRVRGVRVTKTRLASGVSPL